MAEMVTAWAMAAEQYRTGTTSKDDYDRWRYHYPRYDKEQRWAEVPSAELTEHT